MILRICKSQGGESDTPEMVFERAQFDQEMQDATVSVLRRLREDKSERQVWGLISMGSIVLLAENVYHSARYVRFFASSRHKYSVSYLLSEAHHPWQTLSAETNTENTAVAMIFEAMDLSGGWSGAKREATAETPVEPFCLPPPGSLWKMPREHNEIMELLREMQLPNPIQILVGKYGEVTLTQGPPTFLTINTLDMSCWAPSYEAPWPDSTYQGSFRDKEQALALIRSALQKWPHSEKS